MDASFNNQRHETGSPGCCKIDVSYSTVLLDAVLISLSIWEFLLNLLSLKCRLSFLFFSPSKDAREKNDTDTLDG